MGGPYQFEDYMTSARDALREGNTDVAMDWVDQALSLSKHTDEEGIARAHLLKAKILAAEEEYAEAEATLQKSLDMFWRSAEAHVLLGELLLLDGRKEEAASALESALEVSPENADAISLLIFSYGQLERFDLAKRCFDRCGEVAPELAESFYHMGVCLFREGEEGAKELFEKALSRNPVLSGPHYYLARKKIDEGDFPGAEDELTKELELNPANSLAELQLVRSYLLRVEWQEAVELFDGDFPEEVFCDIPALKSCHFHFNYEVFEEKFRPFIQNLMKELPQTPQNLFHVAKIHRYKSLYGEALEFLKKVIESEKEFREAYTEMADLYRVQDEMGWACEVLEEAAALFGDGEAYCKLGRGLIGCGRFSEAEEVIRRAVSLRPEGPEGHYLLGAVLAETASRGSNAEDRMQEAKTSLRRALDLDPGYAEARRYLMYVAHASKEFAECIALAEKALNENAEDPLALSYAGRAYHAMGDPARAEERFSRLVELFPDDQKARSMLAEVYRDQEKFKEAAEELEQAIAVPGRRPAAELFLQLGEVYLFGLSERSKGREYLVRFLQAAPPGHPDADRAKDLLNTIDS
jgi:tetratricopeptide (TPR) repeat protein